MRKILFLFIIVLIFCTACINKVNFNQIGQVYNSGDNTDRLEGWVFNYNENDQENSAELIFTEDSFCQTKKVKAKCLPGNLKNNQNIRIEGIKKNNQIEIKNLYIQ